jgi:hypothetical protein
MQSHGRGGDEAEMHWKGHHIDNAPDGGVGGCNGLQLPPKREGAAVIQVTRKEEQRWELPRKCRVHRQV